MIKIPITAPLCAALFLTACAGFNAWITNPTTQAALTDVAAAVVSYTQGNSLQTATNLVQGSTLLLRSVESPTAPKNVTPPLATAVGSAATAAMRSAKVSPTLAASVGTAVTTLMTNGAPANTALETTARALDSAAAPAASGPRGKSGIIGRAW